MDVEHGLALDDALRTYIVPTHLGDVFVAMCECGERLCSFGDGPSIASQYVQHLDERNHA